MRVRRNVWSRGAFVCGVILFCVLILSRARRVRQSVHSFDERLPPKGQIITVQTLTTQIRHGMKDIDPNALKDVVQSFSCASLTTKPGIIPKSILPILKTAVGNTAPFDTFVADGEISTSECERIKVQFLGKASEFRFRADMVSESSPQMRVSIALGVVGLCASLMYIAIPNRVEPVLPPREEIVVALIFDFDGCLDDTRFHIMPELFLGTTGQESEERSDEYSNTVDTFFSNIRSLFTQKSARVFNGSLRQGRILDITGALQNGNGFAFNGGGQDQSLIYKLTEHYKEWMQFEAAVLSDYREEENFKECVLKTPSVHGREPAPCDDIIGSHWNANGGHDAECNPLVSEAVDEKEKLYRRMCVRAGLNIKESKKKFWYDVATQGDQTLISELQNLHYAEEETKQKVVRTYNKKIETKRRGAHDELLKKIESNVQKEKCKGVFNAEGPRFEEWYHGTPKKERILRNVLNVLDRTTSNAPKQYNTFFFDDKTEVLDELSSVFQSETFREQICGMKESPVVTLTRVQITWEREETEQRYVPVLNAHKAIEVRCDTRGNS